MALTLEAEQKLFKVKLIDFYGLDEAAWLADARKAFLFVKDTFPHKATIRPDDVAKAPKPVIEVDPGLQAELAKFGLKQKYWFGYFTDLIIDRCWSTLMKENPP